MAGLSELQRDNIDLQHLTDITRYVNKLPWQLVAVLTIANQPGTRIPLISPNKLINEKYPAFKELMELGIGAPVQDFFAVERGKSSGRTHMNVFLNSEVRIPREQVTSAWNGMAYVDVWCEPYDPSKDVTYWLKDMVEVQANICGYGGSVVLPDHVPTQTKPNRKRKSDYNRERARVRYRPQSLRFAR